MCGLWVIFGIYFSIDVFVIPFVLFSIIISLFGACCCSLISKGLLCYCVQVCLVLFVVVLHLAKAHWALAL